MANLVKLAITAVFLVALVAYDKSAENTGYEVNTQSNQSVNLG